MNKKYSYLLLSLFTVIFMDSCMDKSKPVNDVSAKEIETNPRAYDSVKAAEYGADDWGMKKYVVAFLKRGPNKSVDSIEKSKLQRAHMENINRLAEEGKLVLAGPFFGNDDLRGIYIFNVDNLEEAEALTNSDPSIKAGVLRMELKEWYGSAALIAINDLHYSVSKNDIVE